MSSFPARREGTHAIRIIAAAALDTVLVLAFAASGRASHDEAVGAAGIWHTAWPFLAGLVIAWVVALVWRRPTAILRSGVPVWIGTVALGLVIRVIFTDGGAALPFVLVASSVLLFALVGWRAAFVLGRILLRRRGRAIPEA